MTEQSDKGDKEALTLRGTASHKDTPSDNKGDKEDKEDKEDKGENLVTTSL